MTQEVQTIISFDLLTVGGTGWDVLTTSATLKDHLPRKISELRRKSIMKERGLETLKQVNSAWLDLFVLKSSPQLVCWALPSVLDYTASCSPVRLARSWPYTRISNIKCLQNKVKNAEEVGKAVKEQSNKPVHNCGSDGIVKSTEDIKSLYKISNQIFCLPYLDAASFLGSSG